MSAPHDADEASDGGRSKTSSSSPASLYARDWGDDEDETRPPHPEPEILARPAQEAEVVKGARAILKNTDPAWTAVTLYSRGNIPYPKRYRGKWWKPVADILVVRWVHQAGRAGASAMWVAGGFDGGQVWRFTEDGRRPMDVPAEVSAADLGAIVASSDPRFTDDRQTWRKNA